MIPDESYIDRKYRKQLFDACTYRPEEKRLGLKTTYRMECPLCGAKGSHLVWLHHRRTWKFLCSTKSRANCQSQMEFPVLLRAWNQNLFLSYQQERFEAGTTGGKFNCPQPHLTAPRRSRMGITNPRNHQDHNQPTGISTII